MYKYFYLFFCANLFLFLIGLTLGVWSFKLSARGIYILKAGPVTKRLSV